MENPNNIVQQPLSQVATWIGSASKPPFKRLNDWFHSAGQGGTYSGSLEAAFPHVFSQPMVLKLDTLQTELQSPF